MQVPAAQHTDTATPLSTAQTGLWYAQTLDARNPIFNTGQFTTLRGALDLTAFTQALNTTMREADGLCLQVGEIDGDPTAVFDADACPQLDIVDLRGQAQAHDTALAAMRADLATPVDLTRDALVRQVLYRIEDDCALWYQRVHHILIDSYGMSLLDNRIAQHYRQVVAQHADPHGALTSVHLALAEDQDYQASAKREQDRAWWLALFDKAPPAASLAEGTALSAHTFHQETRTFDASTSAALIACSERSGVSWPDVLPTLCAAYVARHLPPVQDNPDVVLGVPYMGRMASPAARTPAMLMNIMAVPVAVDETITLDALCQTNARRLRQARRHGRYRSEHLRRDLGLLGASRRLHGPLINVLPFLSEEDAFPGLHARTQVLCAGPVDDMSLTFRANAAGEHLSLSVEANPALYTSAQVQEHADRLQTFIQHALQAPSLAQVPTLTPAEHARWVVEINNTAAPVDATTLPALIAHAMQEHADKPALEFEGTSLSYVQLDHATTALTQRLIEQGVKRGDIVALALPRSIELIVALLAIQRAGAAYLPLDIQHPSARLQGLIDAAQPRLLLTFTRLRTQLGLDAPSLLLDSPEITTAVLHDTHALAALHPAHAPTPDDAAYVLYTSGSTGAPKGVVVTHNAIVNRLQWMRSHYTIGADERILQKTPYTFDVSVWEFFLPFITGATLVVAPPEAHRDPLALAHLIRERHITVLHFVPSMLAAFLDEPQAQGLAPRLVFCSGEALPAALRARFHQVLNAELHNLYGPTEAAVDVTWWPAAHDDASDPVPIGFPVWNTALYVLDEALRPLPPGVTGHLYIAGQQLARGYLGQPELTADLFVANPFVAGTRMYDTGDLACWRTDGALHYMGRVDDQVKIRGQRVELGEIEAALTAAPGVHQAATLVRTDTGQAQLVAYLVAEGTLDLDAVRAFVAARLPDVMVPHAYVCLDVLPLTASGKLDRRAALPAPQAQARSGRAPSAGSEARLAALYADILNTRTTLYADDDFFTLGGHSLLAARLAAAIRAAWELPAFSLGAVFEHTTIARLARHLDALASQAAPDAGDTDGFGRLIVLRTAAPSPRPLAGEGPGERVPTPAAPLICVHPAGGLGWCYGALARAMQRPVLGLQARSLHAHDAGNPWPETLAAMAADYVDALPDTTQDQAVHLVGWSVGGIIAHAMAVELQDRGLPVGLLCLLDAYPSDCWRGEPEPAPDTVYKALLHIAGYDPQALADVAPERDAVIEFLRRSGHPMGELPDAQLDGVIETVARNNRLVRQHQHAHFDGNLLHIRADLDHQGRNLLARHWLPYARHIDTLGLPFLHAHMTGAAAVAQFAPDLERRLTALDAAPTTKP